MGCAASKRIDVAADVYHPPPSSFAVFDITAIKEPWLTVDDDSLDQEHLEKPVHDHVPSQILEKLDTLESDGPKSWDEVSKALEDLKPEITNPKLPEPKPKKKTEQIEKPRLKRRSFSFHTLEELENKPNSKPVEFSRRNNDTWRKDTEPRVGFENTKPVKQNIFIMKDKLEREKEGRAPRWDPLNDYPDKCPPGGFDTVVLYTTSLGGVRRTYEDCNRVRAILENRLVVFDERDVSLHGRFLNELKDLLGEGVSVPRLFVKGRYIGGVDEVIGLNETGKLGRLIKWARVERGVGRKACEGCGGARFIPCFECGGSCKVVVGKKGEKEKCSRCNENGLMECPSCVQYAQSD